MSNLEVKTFLSLIKKMNKRIDLIVERMDIISERLDVVGDRLEFHGNLLIGKKEK